jgi:hypothetical protein
MPMIFNLYVPVEYTFEKYFLPRIESPSLEFFEVDENRRGIQRKGNNHLIVFLDFCIKKASSEFTKSKSDGVDDFLISSPVDIEFFNRMFILQKEVAVYSLSCHGRMSVIAWEVLNLIADNEKVVIEDESGKLMAGPAYVREHKKIMGRSHPSQAS